MSETPSPLKKIIRRENIKDALQFARDAGKTIVFTNGCFDILHVGHTRYLQGARNLGDLLVIGLNSDISVQKLKGPDRPLVCEDERAELLACLSCVDFVCIFGEQRPDSLIEVVQPNIHVKGGDYRTEDLPEAAVVQKHGGRVVIMPLVEGRSTTNILQKILKP